MISKRSDAYRYTVDVAGSDITPLAAIEAYVGPLRVRVHNVSQGGMALIFDDTPPLQLGDIADVSVSIRERAFPIKIEIRGARDKRLNCAFVGTSPVFQLALQEFLQPKFLGDHLQRSGPLSERPGAVELVEGAAKYDAYLGQNQTGMFVWTNTERHCLKLVGVSRDLVFEWSAAEGLKTGRLGGASDEDVVWDKNVEQNLVHYFADILLAWLKSDEGSVFVDKITNSSQGLPSSEPLKFPAV